MNPVRWRFLMFFSFFFLVYGSMNAVWFLKWRRATQPHFKTQFILFAWFLLMVAAPMAIRSLEIIPWPPVRQAFAFVGYTWMAFVLLFLASSLLTDIIIFFIHFGSRFFSFLTPLALRADHLMAFVIPLSITLLLIVYGFFEANAPQIEKLVFPSEKIRSGKKHLRVVQISDVHLSIITGERWLKRICEEVQKADADLIVSTGDLFDGGLLDEETCATLLRGLNPPMGKFAVLGNHECYADPEKSTAFLKACGFTVLRNAGQHLNGVMNIAGVDDPTVAELSGASPTTDLPILQLLPKGFFTLFLKHRPSMEDTSCPLIDLQLSGHTHKGQIFPFGLVIKWGNQFFSGLYRHLGATLFVSPGAGTWGPPIRVLAPPSMTIIDLQPVSLSPDGSSSSP